MALISVSDFFSTGFYFILAIILFLVLLPFFILGGNIVYTFFFSILDFIIYLPKGRLYISRSLLNNALLVTYLESGKVI